MSKSAACIIQNFEITYKKIKQYIKHIYNMNTSKADVCITYKITCYIYYRDM